MNLADFFSRLSDGLSQLIERPTSNLVATSLALAIVVIAMLVLVIIALLTLTNRDRAVIEDPDAPSGLGKPPASPADRAKSGVRSSKRGVTRRQAAWIAAGLAVLAVWAVFMASSRNDFCSSSCHAMVQSADTWESSTHATVRCVDCHESSVVDGVAKRVRHISAELTRSGALDVRALVSSGDCLACHSSILSNEVERNGVKVAHAHFIARGIDCTRCHGSVGHSSTVMVRAGTMSECLRCHGGGKASAACKTCHTGDVGLADVVDRTFGRVRLPAPSCEGCHQQVTCDACHGLRMPHPVDYAEPQQHARAGAFAGRERLCYRCHTERDCGQCHSSLLTSGGHSRDWRTAHARYTTADGRGYCRACHKPEDFCAVCHP